MLLPASRFDRWRFMPVWPGFTRITNNETVTHLTVCRIIGSLAFAWIISAFSGSQIITMWKKRTECQLATSCASQNIHCSLIISGRWMTGSRLMHPLSTKTTIATIDHDVCVMLKPWSSEERMTAVSNGSGYRDDQITYWLSGLIREQKMSKPETKTGKWNEVDSLSEDLRICRGGWYNFYKTCFPLKQWQRQKWKKNDRRTRRWISHSAPLPL